MPVRLTGVLLAAGLWCGSMAAATQAGLPYRPLVWSALGGKITCGPRVVGHQLLCANAHVPAPPHWKPNTAGDPGFVVLGSRGRPVPVALSQNEWVGEGVVKPIAAGRTWRIRGTGIACTIGTRAVHCANGSHHGFTITKKAYRAF